MKTEILLAAILSLSLAACGGGSSSADDPSVPAITAPPAAKVVVDFKAAFLPLFVGAYAGAECGKVLAGVPADKAQPATITVTAAGMLEADGVSRNLLGPAVAMRLGRAFGADGPNEAQYLVMDSTGSSDELALTLSAQTRSGTTGSVPSVSSVASVTSKAASVVCPEATGTPSLQTKSIYAPLAKYLESPKKTVSCSGGAGSPLAAANYSYEFHDGLLKLGDEAVSVVGGLKEEMVLVLHDQSVNYNASSLDGKYLTMVIDKYGTSIGANLIVKGAAYSCDFWPKG